MDESVGSASKGIDTSKDDACTDDEVNTCAGDIKALSCDAWRETSIKVVTDGVKALPSSCQGC